MTDSTEPPPLTQFQMNQFITLAALPTLERALARLRWLEAENADLKARIDTAWAVNAAHDRITDRLRADLATANAELSQRTAEVAKANAERDEARREVCYGYGSMERALAAAKRRGWDCFDAKEGSGA